jgi:hypothetical protein
MNQPQTLSHVQELLRKNLFVRSLDIHSQRVAHLDVMKIAMISVTCTTAVEAMEAHI